MGERACNPPTPKVPSLYLGFSDSLVEGGAWNVPIPSSNFSLAVFGASW